MAKTATRTREHVYIPTVGLKGDANTLKVSVFYSKGGMNYFSYATEPRGYYASVSPVKVEVGERFTSESFVMGQSGAYKLLLAPATRLNAKALQGLTAKVLPIAETLVAPFVAGEHDTVKALIVAAAGVVA